MKGVGRNPKNDGKKKGGLKVHMMIDAHADCATYARIGNSAQTDHCFSRQIDHQKLTHNLML
jgi:hypothetical protein